MISKTLLAGIFLWGVFLLILFLLRPNARLHQITLETTGKASRRMTFSVWLATLLICTLPMGLSPSYNGEKPDYTDQYELLAESLLKGHLYLDYDEIDPKLLAMENPYDPEAREATDVSYHWDHAFYNGHYYMYFGVVPAVLVFLPYRFITGTSLTTYHATQLFAALFICGVFALFYMLARKFFPKMSLALYLSVSAAFSMVSVWYSVSAPALYCTAISAALCMEIWSFFFFLRAVFFSRTEEKSILLAFFGSLFGALSFGCRPPIALANLFVLPLLITFLRGKKMTFRLGRRLCFAASPYVVVGLLLMAYNYARFDSPFEFGQAYQLTIADQSHYGDILSQLQPDRLLRGVCDFFAEYTPMSDQFPFVTFQGVFFNFPLLFLLFVGLLSKSVREKIKAAQLQSCVLFLLLIPVLIAFADVLWAPTVRERYRMDLYWIICLLCFFIIGFFYETCPERLSRYASSLLSVLAFLTICKCILLFLVPYDYNFTFHYIEKLEKIRKILMLGHGVGLY